MHTLPDMLSLLGLWVPIEQALAVEIRGTGLERHLVGNIAEYTRHHGQVLLTAVRVKQHEAQSQLKHDTTDRPYITGMVPS